MVSDDKVKQYCERFQIRTQGFYPHELRRKAADELMNFGHAREALETLTGTPTHRISAEEMAQVYAAWPKLAESRRFAAEAVDWGILRGTQNSGYEMYLDKKTRQ